MFRKLFIGLIILSALTTEGIINTPWNIYNLCLFVNNANSFSEEVNKKLEPVSNNLSSDGSFSDLIAQNKLYTESKGITQIKYDLSIKPLLKGDLTELHRSLEFADDRCVLSYSFTGSLLELYRGLDKDIILSVSDTSPPLYSL